MVAQEFLGVEHARQHLFGAMSMNQAQQA